MRRRTVSARNKSDLKLYILGISVVAAALFMVKIIFSVSGLLAKQESNQLVFVPAPKHFIQSGAELEEDMFEMVQVPVNMVREDTITDPKSLVGLSAKVNLIAGQPVRASQVESSRKLASALQERIPAGMRAMTLSVDATASIEGWVMPGATIDVLLVRQNGITQVIAERVKVLSVGGQLESKIDTPTVAKTITLLVNQEQALAIASALPLGRLAFTLRGVQDDQTWRIKQFEADRLGAKEEPSYKLEGYVKFKDESGKESVYTVADGKLVAAEVKNLPEDLPEKLRKKESEAIRGQPEVGFSYEKN